MKNLFALLFLLLLSLSFSRTKASHLIVGEMSYEFLGSNKYEFTVSLYRDCRPPSQGGGAPAALIDDDPLIVTVFNGSNFHSVDSHYSTSIYYIPSDFINNCLNNGPSPCVNRMQFKFELVLPASTSEYTILTQRCCMSSIISNISNPSNLGHSLFTKIPPSIIGTNSSAHFVNTVSSSLFCMNKKYTIDHSAIDSDGDSLSYEFCEIDLGASTSDPKPTISSGTLPIFQHPQYLGTYSALYPMPGISINSKTGELTIDCNMQGGYLVGISVNEWRNGVKINTTKRAYTYTVQSCDFSTMAKIVCDSISQNGTYNNTCIANCINNTITFKNKSIGANIYHWDFGVLTSNDDTSNLAEPTFTYPDTGRYRVSLTVYGANCTDSVVEYVNISRDELIADFTITGNFCIGDSIQFSGIGTSTSDTVQFYLWNIKHQGQDMFIHNQNPLVAFQQEGLYVVNCYAINSKGCYTQFEKDMTLTSLQVAAYGDTIVPLNTAIYLDASGAEKYHWDYATKQSGVMNMYSNVQKPLVQFNKEETYVFVVTGSNSDGCIGKDTATIVYANDGKIFTPNAFSPNGDNLNDVFRIYLDGYYFKQLKIYNRRGQQVFESTDIAKGWDGRFKGSEAASETYYWFAELLNSENKSLIKKGDLILIR